MKFSSVILFIVVLLSFSSCGKREVQKALNQAECCMSAQPDSALAIIRAIDTTLLNTPGLRAHYALLHAMALDKNWIDTTDVGVVMPAVEYYDRHPSGIRHAKAWYYLGRIQENEGDIPSAHISFLKAEKWAKDVTDDYFMSLVWQSLSNTYGKSYLNEEALKYSELSLQASYKICDTAGIIASQYRIAQDLNNLQRYSEADSVCRLLLENEIDLIPSNLYPAIVSDYALLRLQHYDDYESAVRLFGEAIMKSGYLRNHNLWGAYAYALLRTNQADKSGSIFRQLDAIDNDHALTYKIWKSRADAYLGNYASAYERLSLTSDIQQGNVNQVLKQSTLRAQMAYQEQENEDARKATLRRIIILISILFLLLALATAIIYYLKRRNTRIIAERESMLESFRTLSDDYARIRKDQDTIRARYITMFQTHFGQTGQIDYLLRHSASERETYLYQELRKAVGSIRTDEESRQLLETILNDSFDGIMLHFRETFPNRKPRFYMFASFLFAGFDATIICNIIHELSKDNVYVEKSRLKKLIRETESPYSEQFLSLLR